MKTLPRVALAAALLSLAGVAAAAQPISLLLPVTYPPESAVLHKTREACKPEARLANDIGAELQKRSGRPATTSSMTGVVLRVAILASGGIGGGGWTGSKSLTVKVDELQDGEMVRSRGFTGKSRGGLAGPFEGTCGILEGISGTLAKDIVDWSGTETNAAFDTDLAARRLAKAQAAAQDAEPAASAAQ